jgi:hypothetical protein
MAIFAMIIESGKRETIKLILSIEGLSAPFFSFSL